MSSAKYAIRHELMFGEAATSFTGRDDKVVQTGLLTPRSYISLLLDGIGECIQHL